MKECDCVKKIILFLFSSFAVLHPVFAWQQECYEFWYPDVTVITSLYKGSKFIKGFMEDLVAQTFFHKCEFLIIGAHSPDQQYEDEIIMPYANRYPNIIYTKLQEGDPDPGLYEIWNRAIRQARGKYIINANVDDRLAPDAIEILSQALDANPNIDLVYSACYISRSENETFEMLDQRPLKIILDWPNFSRSMMRICLPGNHPMWRKSMHEKCGYFDPEYKAAGDWEFFLRAVECGCVFMKVPFVLGTFYENVKGLTRSKDHGREMVRIEKKYSYMWNS